MNKKKISVSIFFIILLLSITPTLQLEPVFAENKIRQVIRIAENYPVNTAFQDIEIDPKLENIDKTLIFFTVSHISESDASDTFRSVKILDNETVRIIGENTALGNNAIDYIITLVEFDSNSEINVQHLQADLAGVAGIQEFSMGSVNTTNSFIISRGHHINASTTNIGDSNYPRVRILNSTFYEIQIDDIPPTPSGLGVSIVDMNQSDVSVQRGNVTLDGTTITLTGGVNFTSIDPSRTLLFVTNDWGGGNNPLPNRPNVGAFLTSGGDIVFSRGNANNFVFIAWELIEFPATSIKVGHFDTLLGDGISLVDETVPEIKDLDKAIAMSHSGSPFGWSAGDSNNGKDNGELDTAQVILSVRSNTVVGVQRDDNEDTLDVGWQLIEFLEQDVAENAQGNNTLRQIVKIEDEYQGSSADEQFFTISPPLLNITKALLFMSTSNTYNPNTTDISERVKRYEIFNTTSVRITGSNDAALTNEAMPFSATIVEFDSNSPIQIQRDQIQHSADSSLDARYFEGEFFMHSSPLNATGSNIMSQGWSGTQGGSGGVGDFTFGAHEIATIRIVNDTRWGYELDNPLDFQEAVAVVTLNNYNQNNIFVQRGETSIVNGTSTIVVSPSTNVIQNQTLLFATITSTNNEFDNEPDDLAVLAHLDNSSPPDIIFEKDSAEINEAVNISWELISFPIRSLFVQHGIHNMTAGQSNTTSTLTRPVENVTESFVIGTVNFQNGYSGGKGSLNTTDSFGEVTAKMTLDNSTHARFERGLSAGSFDVGFQVVEFQDLFCEVCLETTGIAIETNATGDPVPACCTDGVQSNPNATYTELQVDVIHQLLEWFNPTSASMDAMINDIEINGKALFEIILRMGNGTYGVDANLTKSAEFYQDKYLVRGNLTEFINNIITDVRTNFGATTP